jgi:hypothetical protein
MIDMMCKAHDCFNKICGGQKCYYHVICKWQNKVCNIESSKVQSQAFDFFWLVLGSRVSIR